MSSDDDSYIHDLNQIRARQSAMLDEIEQIKLRNAGALPAEIEEIRSQSLKILDDIDEIRYRREYEVQADMEAGKSGNANPD